MEPIRAFETVDGALYKTAADAKRHEARMVLCGVLSAHRRDLPSDSAYNDLVNSILDNAGTIGAALNEMQRADIQPATPTAAPVARPTGISGQADYSLASQPQNGLGKPVEGNAGK